MKQQIPREKTALRNDKVRVFQQPIQPVAKCVISVIPSGARNLSSILPGAKKAREIPRLARNDRTLVFQRLFI
jgi:hypothetical protein